MADGLSGTHSENLPTSDATASLLALTTFSYAGAMRFACIALGLLALLAVAYAAEVEEPAELAHKSKHSHKK
jgi:hypothetical protein